jgi:hypothetical protein
MRRKTLRLKKKKKNSRKIYKGGENPTVSELISRARKNVPLYQPPPVIQTPLNPLQEAWRKGLKQRNNAPIIVNSILKNPVPSVESILRTPKVRKTQEEKLNNIMRGYEEGIYKDPFYTQMSPELLGTTKAQNRQKENEKLLGKFTPANPKVPSSFQIENRLRKNQKLLEEKVEENRRQRVIKGYLGQNHKPLVKTQAEIVAELAKESAIPVPELTKELLIESRVRHPGEPALYNKGPNGKWKLREKKPAAAQQTGPLPPLRPPFKFRDWELGTVDETEYFFHNKVTDETQWELNGWEVASVINGLPTFVNKSTGETSTTLLN